ncbi:MAG TPA: hypothetical protein PLD20_29540 [Blastocatellia bacterium]|nr:hypothetical protein [Blastocatellia bacterium]HMV84635.1 hypothetical protein [Blastocatellia bacterium]HMY71437.1 hypothetical protein [Blastocatellia bacterium]HMZ22113.1 hypothetical protein [Blastocatellia bacterium]HNG29024.1 hypothetical protein [Blastocatellia bacterium]
MRKPARIIYLVLLLFFLRIAPQAATVNLKFTDGSGKPVPDVVVRGSYTSSILFPNQVNTFETKSDAEGLISIMHPSCSNGSGSCCMMVSPVTYQVIGKFGYNFVGGGTVACGAGLPSQQTIVGSGQEYPRLTAVSGANYQELLTGDQIVAAFGTNLAAITAVAALPLPTALGGRMVFIRDWNGIEQVVQLLFVSPTQINFIMPPTGELSGFRTLIVKNESNQVISVGVPRINQISPGFFSANADGQGLASAVILRVRADDSRQYEAISRFDETQRKFVPIPIDLGPESEFVVLALFGTGWRRTGAVSDVNMKIGGIDCPIDYVGDQPTIEGLDQINVRLPRALIGRGDVTIEAQFRTGFQANPVQIRIK